MAVEIATDPNPDCVDPPAELTKALAIWPEAETTFNSYSDSHRRAMAYRVAESKQPKTRARRTV